MKRVSVIGTTGSGKTTFARALGAVIGAPHVELDRLFWEPDWKMAELETFRVRVRSAITGERWVVDGNYRAAGALELVWSRADTVVWLDYPLPLTLVRLARRVVARIRDGAELWPGTGNRETVRNAFFNRDSLLWFALRTHRGRRRRLAEMLTRTEFAHLAVYRFRHTRDADHWLEAQRQLVAARI